VRLDEAHTALKDRKVAVVGCGSLGGKVAVMLARAGVGHFLLVDDDIMLPDNVVRHELDWREMGRHKVDGVARRIGLINPAASCDIRQYRLGGQQSSGSVEMLIERLATCDLIIDASADPKVFTYLGAAATIGKKALLWAEVFGGGFGGLVARHRPDREPAPAMMRAKIEQWCLEQGKPIERAAGGYEGQMEGVPMIADDADVSVIAAHAARLAIDTVIRRDPSIFPNSVYLIGLSQGWVFDQPFDTRPIDVGLAEPAQSDEPADKQLVEEETARVLQLTRQILKQLQSELGRAQRCEIGGLLLGEHLEGETFRLVEVTVQRSGGSAVHFVRDPALNQKQLDDFFKRTGVDYTHFNYLGEWHSHPSFEPLPSPTDIRTMQSIVEYPAVGVNFLILMIVRLTRWRQIKVSVMMFQANANPRQVQISVEKDSDEVGWFSGKLLRIFSRR
jgi:integrative and conjugative element protein (TIGR02256 family)